MPRSQHITIEWLNNTRPISELVPADYNPRASSPKEDKDLSKSLQRFNLADPIIINANNKVIGGHFRLRMLKDQGVQVVDVRRPSRLLTDEEERELNLRLNKNQGQWDWKLLEGFGKEMISDVGFNPEELDKIFSVVIEDDFNAEEEYGKITEAVTKPGDMYQLGPHRLLCGDATQHDAVAKLMGDQLANMVFTDPPYNVNYKYAKYEAIHKGRRKKFENGGKIFNDNKTADDFYTFLLNVFQNIYLHSMPSMAIYVCHATKTQAQFFNAFHDAGFHFSQTIIWIKERIILALGQDYHRVYEPIIFGWKQGENHYKNKDITTEKEVWDLDKIGFEERLDVWYLSRDKSCDYEHPTQKPVRLPERAIKKNCPRGGLLFEPFCGSGSTLLAAHQLDRRCFAMELDPKYCDVIVNRFERFSGQKAQLIH